MKAKIQELDATGPQAMGQVMGAIKGELGKRRWYATCTSRKRTTTKLNKEIIHDSTFGPDRCWKKYAGSMWMFAVREGWKWLSTGQMPGESDDSAVIDVLKPHELVSDELTAGGL